MTATMPSSTSLFGLLVLVANYSQITVPSYYLFYCGPDSREVRTLVLRQRRREERRIKLSQQVPQLERIKHGIPVRDHEPQGARATHQRLAQRQEALLHIVAESLKDVVGNSLTRKRQRHFRTPGQDT